MVTFLQHNTANSFLSLLCLSLWNTERNTARQERGPSKGPLFCLSPCNHSTPCLAFHVANSKHVQTPSKPQCSGSSYSKQLARDHRMNPWESPFYPLKAEIKMDANSSQVVSMSKRTSVEYLTEGLCQTWTSPLFFGWPFSRTFAVSHYIFVLLKIMEWPQGLGGWLWGLREWPHKLQNGPTGLQNGFLSFKMAPWAWRTDP